MQEVDKDKRVLELYEVSIRFPGIFNNFIASKRDKAFFDSSFYNCLDERIKFLAETSLSTISKCKSLKERVGSQYKSCVTNNSQVGALLLSLTDIKRVLTDNVEWTTTYTGKTVCF